MASFLDCNDYGHKLFLVDWLKASPHHQNMNEKGYGVLVLKECRT